MATREPWLLCPFKLLKVLNVRVRMGPPDSWEWALCLKICPLQATQDASSARHLGAPPYYTELSGTCFGREVVIAAKP